MFNRLREDWYWYCQACEHYEEKPRYHRFAFGYVRNVVPSKLLELICKWRGHDWHDDSYGGPDSGCMAGHCKRCGYSFHHTLY